MTLIRKTTITVAKFTLLALVLAVHPAISRSGRTLSPASAPGTIVDTLGQATPATQFSVFGSGGQGILADQTVGPQFILTEQTNITEIGAFVENCISIVNGVPQCPSPPPFVVQIRPDKMGVPDKSTIIASFVLSNNGNPLLVTYESVHPNLLLNPGTYYALFATQSADSGGYMLGTALSPFKYQAGSPTVGFLNVTTGNASTGVVPIAARILSTPPLDVCLKDDTTGNSLQWSSVNGQYKFTRCSDGFTLTGTGVAKLVNGIATLTDIKPDRRVSAGRNLGQQTGNATIYFQYAPGVWQSFTIHATNPTAVCACPG